MRLLVATVCGLAATVVIVLIVSIIRFSDQPIDPEIEVPDEPQVASIAPTPAEKPFQGCRIRGTGAAVCTSGRAAIMAYQVFGSDVERLRQSHSQQMLAEAGCFVITNSGPPIEQMSRGKVAFSDGWVGVTMVNVGPGGGAIADSYLEGTCERYVPKTFTLKQEYGLPDYGAEDKAPADLPGDENSPSTVPSPSEQFPSASPPSDGSR